jgi:KDO2-lipid IV(A) lauroyltransferase
MKVDFLYYLLLFFVRLVAFLPLRFLYILSDLLFYPTYYLIGYRRKVVRENLQNSFPEKSLDEIISIEKRFYRHFCDYMMESIKQVSFSIEEIMERAEVKNIELINDRFAQGRSVIMLLGHYGNWEWYTSMIGRQKEILVAQVYRRLKNRSMDRLFLKIRSVYNTINIEKNTIFRELVQIRKKKQQILVGLLSDQTPSKNNLIYWTKFLNQDTSVLVGAERIASKLDYDVYYMDIQKVARGKYTAEVKLISNDPTNSAEFEITEKYARYMEETILRDPAYWLWTHRRWKHKPPHSI